MTIRHVRRTLEFNGSQIDSWLWIAHHAIRTCKPAQACEAMLSALWLLVFRPWPGEKRTAKWRQDRVDELKREVASESLAVRLRETYDYENDGWGDGAA